MSHQSDKHNVFTVRLNEPLSPKLKPNLRRGGSTSAKRREALPELSGVAGLALRATAKGGHKGFRNRFLTRGPRRKNVGADTQSPSTSAGV
jgi:hypothetical protein